MNLFDNKIGLLSILDKKEFKQNRWTSKLLKKIYKNKIIVIFMMIFACCVILNIIYIYNFFRILKQI